jgi:signal peptidase I
VTTRPARAAAPAPSGSAPRRASGHRPSRVVTVVVLAAALVGVLGLLRSYVAGPVRISSQSMEPTLYAGDVVLVDRRGVDLTDVQRGDLVTFRSPVDGQETLKRVVALPGDSVATIDAVLHVNDEPVTEPYVDFSDWEGIFGARVEVPEGEVFVLGDNRGASVDSREFGPVPVDALDGQVLVRLWPPVRPGDRTEPPRP